MRDAFTMEQWKVVNLKYILKVIKYQKQNGLPNTLLLLLVKVEL